MKWSICILTIPQRTTDVKRLVDILTYQIADRDDIEIVVNDSAKDTVGEKRQRCLQLAQGEYVNFIDDDDLPAHNYIESIYPLLDGVDYIGFRMQLYFNGEKRKPTYHSLRYKEWSEDEEGFYRNISHLNPMRTEIARRGNFIGNYAEDLLWSQQVTPYTKTEHYIKDPMYFYFYAPDHSATNTFRPG